MKFETCRSCGGDLSAVPVKRRLFTQFMMKVVRCPHCTLRTTLLARRTLVGGRQPAHGLRDARE